MPEKTVKSMFIKNGIGQKSGKPYHSLVIDFECGYTFESFLSNEQYFILKQIVEEK